ncbi:MAG: hypothetical protein JXR83_03580, partial [Deltaproteobacteria bacterium]|nr:hypothetical protein [Deltaproteobacteria bacterium]
MTMGVGLVILVAVLTGVDVEAAASAPAPSSLPADGTGGSTAFGGENPGYRDVRVSDRSPGLTGQTGLFRVLSAKTGAAGYFDLGLHGRYFRANDFIVADSVDQAVYGSLTLGGTLNQYLELSLSSLVSVNENSALRPSTMYSAGDLGVDIKLAFPVSVFAFGLDLRGYFPADRDQLGLELDNFGAQAMALATLDLWDERGLPLRV